MQALQLVHLFLFLFIVPTVQAGEHRVGESLGQFEIEEILLRPTYYSREVTGAEFSLGDTSIRFQWIRDNKLSAHLGLGSLKERPVPQYYNATDPEDTFGVYEAYADYDGIYGRFRMGLIPLNFGYEGYLPNAALNFNRSQLYLDRYVVYRDFGVSFYTEHNGYYTELIAHNGEGSSDNQDGKLWTTARWGWTNDRHLRVQISAQTGRTSPKSTVSGASGFAGFANSEAALWRLGAFSIHYYPYSWEVALQTNLGEMEQSSGKGAYEGEQLDVLHFFKNKWGLGLRYDRLDPNRELSGDGVTNTSIAVVYGEQGATSRFYLITTKRVEEGTDISSDELRFIWRVTPYN